MVGEAGGLYSPASEEPGNVLRGHNLFPLVLRLISGHSEAAWRIGVQTGRCAWSVDRVDDWSPV
jgi:hypothetical protein